jgi:hypothetical protein
MAEETPDNSGGHKAGKRRHWLRRLLTLLVVLGGLLWSAPYIVSTGPGTRLAMGYVGSQVRGDVQVEDLSLTWLGPIRLTGLRVTATNGQEVLSADGAELSAGVWRLLTAGESLGETDVHGLRTVVRAQSGRPQPLVEALRPARPPKESTKPPPLRGTVRLHGGTVRVIRADGRTLNVENLSTTLTMDTLDDLVARIRFSVAGGQMELTARVSGLAGAGDDGLLGTESSGELQTRSEMDVARLGTFLGRSDLAGNAKVIGSFDISNGRAMADVWAWLEQLHSVRPDGSEGSPTKLYVECSAWASSKRAGGTLEFSGPLAELKLDGEGPTDRDRWQKVSPWAAVQAFLAGQKTMLPDFRLSADGELNASDIADTLPTVLNLRERVRVPSGRINLDDVVLQGGEWPSASGRIHAEKLEVQHGGKLHSCGPLEVDFSALSAEGTGPQLSANVTAPFARARAETVTGGLRAELEELDLDALGERLTTAFEVDDLQLAGRAQGHAVVTLKQLPTDELPEELPITGRLTAQNLLYSRNGRRFRAGRLASQWTATLRTTGNRPAHLSASAFSLDVDDDISVAGPVGLALKGDTWSVGPEMKLRVRVRPLLARLLAAGVLKKAPNWTAERLTWTGRADSTAEGISAKGKGTVVGPQKVGAPQPLIDEPVHFTHTLKPLDDGDALDLTRATLSSEATVSSGEMSAQCQGTVTDLDGEVFLDLTGKYAGPWDRLTELLHRLVPETRGRVTVRGQAEGTFDVEGPLCGPTGNVTAAGLNGDAGVGWASANVVGMELQQADLSPKLVRGVASVGGTPIRTADEGHVRLPVEVRLDRDVPLLVLLEPADVLDGVPVTAETGRELLSRFNPIFANLAGLDGQLTLRLEALELPLDKEKLNEATGRGRLDTSRMNVRPAGILAELLRLEGLATGRTQSMSVRGAGFRINDGRVEYEEFTLDFGGGLDLEFDGSVGFDDTLDLRVSVPVRAELLRLAGVGGAWLDYARVLEGVRVEIPIIGTRLNPRLDLSRMDIAALLEEAQDLLLLEKLRDAAGPAGGTTQRQPGLPRTTTEPTTRPRRGGLMDILWDVLEQPPRDADDTDRE